MTPARQKLLFLTHLAALALGATAGALGWLPGASTDAPPIEPASTENQSGRPTGRTTTGSLAENASIDHAGSSTFTPADYSAAWDSLKDSDLPRTKRLRMQAALLEGWSLVDLESAVRAIFEESSIDGPSGSSNFGLLGSCAPGIRSDLHGAWDLCLRKAFGWETVRFRRHCLSIMAKENPGFLVSIHHQLPNRERIMTVDDLAHSWSRTKDPQLAEKIWSGLSTLANSEQGDRYLRKAGTMLAAWGDPAKLVSLMKSEPSADSRQLATAGIAALLQETADELFESTFENLSPEMRAEVSAAALKFADLDQGRTLQFAELVSATGDWDSLQAAAAAGAFARFAESTEDPAALVDWATRLPIEERTESIYHQSLRGAAISDFPATRTRVETLPPGPRRDHGLAALASAAAKLHLEATLLDELIDSITDPGIQADAREKRQSLGDQ